MTAASPGFPISVPAETGQAPTAGRFYRPELDIVRFLAFFLVFIHHVFGFQTPLSRTVGGIGALGMCLFFFLSSYLITELLQREKRTTGRVHLRAFYIRRALRSGAHWEGFFGTVPTIASDWASFAL